ncbi:MULTISPECIES: LysM peptidoglycan-binding domain-containing protein [unclassified Streptomyces]|uniref:LysM peptidoglycan-binding domain-containing protein n=1 Tax=unclassified Streptomyces TaxID=2593676 RepID=UPI001BE88197|nr:MULTISPECIES: LysM peptidoglycan-binding domain-containing protein [unclassified Streptomyces]MBT2404606.1 LysM peptidoglycan-binding domain-containing protein [Streptomyces sp. ISL-21]MBT2610488.1 LysM peptidoglycan-binding domain-containing protein [Streptomyces sp. ISL-87]
MSTPLRLLRALLGLAVLAALIAGIPLVLLAVGYQPTDFAGGWDLLTQQDDGQLFFTVLTTIGWIGWALFTLSALVEIVALFRGRKAKRIKGLGGMQSFAGLLIGGLVLIAPTAASAATTGPAVAATAVQTAGTSSVAAAQTAAEQDAWPTHTVTGDSELPWDLAEQYLGSGPRWKDIAALNPSIPQLAAGDQFLPKGTVIRLPADANIAKPAAPAPAPSQAAPETAAPAQQPAQTAPTDAKPAAAQAEHVVKSGENLWGIADEHGDPEDWPKIFEANRGKPLPGGGTFDNPDLIVPGQELTLPTATAPAPAPDSRPAPDTKTPPKPETAKDTPTPTAPAPAPSTPSTPAPAASTPSTAPTTAVPTPEQDGQKADTAQQLQDADEGLAPAAVWMGAGALAAALIGTLATRRILQQRRRRPGRRIPMPTGSAAATEQGLRAAQHPTGFDLLDAALRTLALNLTAAERDLPVVTAVVLHEQKVELHLDQDTPPMKPFSGTVGRTDLWTCPASSPDLADHDDLQGADAPYPALVSLGWDGAGRLVLVDLEYVGVLHLDGDADHARHVLQAIAVELASTPLPGHLEITALADTAPGLDDAAPERVARTATLAEAVADLTSHTADQRRALDALGAPTLRAARLNEDAGGSWTPHILLAAELPEGAQTEALLDLITAQPQVAGAVVTASETADLAPEEGWTLHCAGPDETIVLPGSGLPIKLQGLTDPHFADAIELLTLSAADTDVPARDEWLDGLLDAEEQAEEDQAEQDREDGSEDAPSDDVEEIGDGEATQPEAGADEDGMPDEYADIEREELETAHQAEADTPTDETGEGAVQPAAPTSAVSDGQAEHGTTGPTLPDLFDPPVDFVPAPAAAALEPAPEAAPVLTKQDAAQAEALEAEKATPTPAPARVPAPAPTRGVDDADDTEATYGSAPKVLLLGRVLVEGAAGRIDSNRLNAAVELVSYLALNPGADHHAIDDALWPGRLVNKEMRNSVISRTRSWLGKNADGEAYFPRVQHTGDSRYRLAQAVTCDWKTFQNFARTGLARHDEDGELALRRALALVRGRPFAAIDPQRYAWAEPAVQEMVSAIADVAYELSTRRREAADYAGALWAAHQGLLAAEENELLHRQVFLAHHAAGDVDALREAAARLARINEGLGGGVDMEAETAQLLSTLLPKPVILR